jgi:DNA-binding NtrC family response regulator
LRSLALCFSRQFGEIAPRFIGISARFWQAGCSLAGMTSGIGNRQKAILAIDDESDFLLLLKDALQCHGYTVHTASDPIDALKVYQEKRDEIGMVLLDYLFPEMSGDTVFDELQRFNPDVRVVLVTGCEESVAENMLTKGLRGYLQKPFDLTDLTQKVRDAINAPELSTD